MSITNHGRRRALAVFASVLAAACARDAERPSARVAARVVTLSGEGARGETIDLYAVVRAQGGHGEPIPGDVLRRVRCIGVLDVDTLEIESDRGRERVRIHGLDGRDARWPAELNAYLRDVAQPALDAWLHARGTELFERSLAVYEAGGAACGPSYASIEGDRIVTLVRRDAHGAEIDVRSKALDEGWAYRGVPYTDSLAVDARFALAESRTTCGLFELSSVRRLLADLGAEARSVSTLDDAALDLVGDEITASLAAWLDWTPQVELRFRGATPDDACEPFHAICARHVAAIHAWARTREAQMRASATAAGRDDRIEIRVESSPPEVLAQTAIQRFDAFSPAGPDIWFLRKDRLSRGLLEATLAHEIAHQYQEEVLYAGEPFPPIDGSAGVLEAHAECIAASWVRATRAEPDAFRSFSYHELVPHFELLKRTLALSDDELLRRFRGFDWKASEWARLVRYEIGIQQWLFEQTGRTEFDGLDFAPVASDDGQVLVDIHNRGDVPFRGQLHGIWLWKTAESPDATTTMRVPPCNVFLAPRASLRVRLAEEPHWKDISVQSVTGLVGRTFAPLD